MGVRTGLEVLVEDQKGLLSGARIGAVVHPASISRNFRHTADLLLNEKAFQLVSLFGPQHGARGEKQDNMIESEFYRDPDTGLPVHSLYGDTRRPTHEMMEDVDVLLYDLQDVGTRVYTFIWTLAYCLEACASSDRQLIVLDRPNPINGLQVEGDILDPAYSSYVGLYPIPMRHGMTVGELALFFNGEFRMGCNLKVIPMEGWNRSLWFEETGLPWVPPSPNIPTVDSAVVYPGMVLVEGTALSEGRGTTKPFELIGAPYIRPGQYASYLNGLGLPGVQFRPTYFQPTFQKHAEKMCGGAQLHVLDRDAFEPYLTGVAAITAARSLYPAHFAWRQPPYEYEYRKLPIEILCGGRRIPDLIEAGAAPDQVREAWYSDVADFHRRRKPYLLYS